MEIIDFEKAKAAKTLKNGQINDEEQVAFQKIPDELKRLGIQEIKIKDGRRLTYEELQCIVNFAKEFAKKYPTKASTFSCADLLPKGK